MIKGVRLDTRGLIVLLFVIAIFVSLAGFVAHAQEDSVVSGDSETVRSGQTESSEVVSDDHDDASGDEVEVSADAAEIIDEVSETDLKENVFVNVDDVDNQEATVIVGNLQTNQGSSGSEDSENEIVRLVVKAGEIEVMAESDEVSEIMEKIEEAKIEKEDSVFKESSLWRKEVRVDSEIHFDHELIVYAEIPESDEEDVSVNWVEEGKSPKYDLLDENDNGEFELVKIYVPHLSEQNFEIVVNFQEGNSENLTLTTLQSPGEFITEETNLEFEFNISYGSIESVLCDFGINNSDGQVFGDSGNINSFEEVASSELGNGDYSWSVYCYDSNITEQNDLEEGSFVIDMPISFSAFSENPSGSVSYSFGRNYQFGAIITGNGVENVGIRFNGINHSVIGDSDEFVFERSNLAAGVYSYYWYAYDSSGNYGNSSMKTYTISKAGPSGSISGTSSINNGTAANILASETNAGDADVTYKLYRNGVLLNNNSDGSILSAGQYTYEYNSTGGQNYSASTIDTFVLNVVSTGDTEKPKVNLIYPEDNAVISSNQVNFEYNASDNVGIANCTFQLFYYNNSNVGELVYEETNKSFTNGGKDIVELVNFDEGEYTWEVECYDSSNNRNSRTRNFEYLKSASSSQSNNKISLSESEDYEGSDKVEALLESINEFLIDSGRYGKEEREVLDDLGITDEMVFYKKKLNQIKLDLQHNLDFVPDEDRREERKREILAEIDEIEDKTVTGIEVMETSEYVKNSLDVSIDSVVESYVKSKNLVLGSRASKKISDFNEELQGSVSVSVNAKNVEIDYYAGSKKITLITKEPKTDDSEGVFLEVVPKEVAQDSDEITFVNDFKVIERDPILEISRNNLVNGKIVYYVESFKDLEKIESSDTLLFMEKVPDGASAISGFSVLLDSAPSGGFLVYISWIVVLVIFIVGGFFAVSQLKLRKYSDNHEVRAINSMIRESERMLEMNDLASAKDHYERIGELYSFVPDEGKPLVYRKIESLRVKIDKKEVGELINECISALREGRKEDAILLYEEIQKMYNKMPSKIQDKIYEKMLPYVRMLSAS